MKDWLEEYLGKTMIEVKGGKFIMGEGEEEHEVVLDDFRVSKYQVTQELYEKVMRKNPSHFKGKERPVECVDWYDAIEFCNALSELMGLEAYYEIDKEKQDPNNTDENDQKKWLVEINENSQGYRLLTEAEWEYAARGGQKGKEDKFEYAGGNKLDEVGWYYKNSHIETKVIGLKEPNQLGLYDMSGNVWEWCWDWYEEYKEETAKNPKGAKSGERRVVRGGSRNDYEDYSHMANRSDLDQDKRFDDIGFRISRAV